MVEIPGLARAGHAAQIVGDDLAEIEAELAQREELLAAPVEDLHRGVDAPGGGPRIGGAGGGEEPGRGLVGDVGEALGDRLGVAVAQRAEAGVERQQRVLGLVEELLVLGGAGRLRLGREGAPQPAELPARQRHEAAAHLEPAVGRGERLVHGADRDRLGVCFAGEVLLGARRGGRLVGHPEGGQIGHRVARVEQALEAPRLGLADLRGDDHDGRALPPLGPGDRVVVAGLDGDLDGRVHLLEERIARLHRVPAAIDEDVGGRVREDAPLFPGAGAEDEIDLPEAVVVGGLVVDGDVRLVEEAHGARGALDRDVRRLVRDGGDALLVGLAHAHAAARRVAELGGDPQGGAVGDRPAGDEQAGAVVDERDVGAAVREHHRAARVHWPAAHDQRGAAGLLGGAEGAHVRALLVQVLGRRGAHVDLVDPGQAERGVARARDEDVDPLEDAERLEEDQRRARGGEGEAGARPAERSPGGALAEARQRGAGEEALEVEGGEGRRAGAVVDLRAGHQGDRPQRGGAELRIHADDGVRDHPARVGPAAPPHHDARGEAEQGEPEGGRGRGPRDGVAQARQMSDAEEDREDERDEGPPRRGLHLSVPGRAQARDGDGRALLVHGGKRSRGGRAVQCSVRGLPARRPFRAQPQRHHEPQVPPAGFGNESLRAARSTHRVTRSSGKRDSTSKASSVLPLSLTWKRTPRRPHSSGAYSSAGR